MMLLETIQPSSTSAIDEAAVRTLYQQLMDGWNQGSGTVRPLRIVQSRALALPPGRICGQRCVASPCGASSVSGWGAPPESEIRDRTPPCESVATM